MYPSVGVVYAKSTSLSKNLKDAANKVDSLRRTWTKKNSGDDEIIYDRLEYISSIISRVHREIGDLGDVIGEKVEPEKIKVPDTVTLTFKEFMFLQSVFISYTQGITGDIGCFDHDAIDEPGSSAINEPKIKSQ